jgi:hypothetical protein
MTNLPHVHRRRLAHRRGLTHLRGEQRRARRLHRGRRLHPADARGPRRVRRLDCRPRPRTAGRGVRDGSSRRNGGAGARYRVYRRPAGDGVPRPGPAGAGTPGLPAQPGGPDVDRGAGERPDEVVRRPAGCGVPLLSWRVAGGPPLPLRVDELLRRRAHPREQPRHRAALAEQAAAPRVGRPGDEAAHLAGPVAADGPPAGGGLPARRGVGAQGGVRPGGRGGGAPGRDRAEGLGGDGPLCPLVPRCNEPPSPGAYERRRQAPAMAGPTPGSVRSDSRRSDRPLRSSPPPHCSSSHRAGSPCAIEKVGPGTPSRSAAPRLRRRPDLGSAGETPGAAPVFGRPATPQGPGRSPVPPRNPPRPTGRRSRFLPQEARTPKAERAHRQPPAGTALPSARIRSGRAPRRSSSPPFASEHGWKSPRRPLGAQGPARREASEPTAGTARPAQPRAFGTQASRSAHRGRGSSEGPPGEHAESVPHNLPGSSPGSRAATCAPLQFH